ncbi:MAG: aminotransferase class I/II-fold pyridoxal phosphate-dependent enzyme, partial [Acidimicrobiia bacterium]
VEEMRSAYHQRRDRVLELLDASRIPAIRPAGAFYVWIDVTSSGLNGLAFARHLLTDYRVAVTPGTTFGPAGDPFVRVSLATDPSALYEGVARLTSAVQRLEQGSI